MLNEPEDTNRESNTDTPTNISELLDTTPADSPSSDGPVLPINESSKKPSKKKILIFVLIAISLVAVMLLLSYAFSNYVASKNPKKVSKPVPTHFASAKAAVDQAKPYLDGAELVTVTSDGLGGKTEDGYGTYGLWPYVSSDRAYANLPAESSGVGYQGDSIAATENYANLVNFFAKNKFSLIKSGKNEVGPISWSDKTVTYVDYAIYESDTLVCMIWNADATQTKLATHIASIGCGEKTSYKAAAVALDPFYAAYTKGVPNKSKDIMLANPEVGPAADGYKNAVLLQSDSTYYDGQFEGLYYQTPNSKEWVYFNGNHGVLLCSQYNTPVLKKAFNNFTCKDDVTKEIIGLQ